MTKQQEPLTPEQKLDLIVAYLHQMNRRDRARTMASFFSGLLHLCWFFFIIYITWYSFANMDVLLEKITSEAAEQAVSITSGGTGSFLDALSNDQIRALTDRVGEMINKQR
ncbi:MAG TPA: hypothetical protein VI913_04740 [Candidatus Peribacteraceae bacterium]|nr:hypothetical protein [Candidatus Peribacteraceae bacterium]